MSLKVPKRRYNKMRKTIPFHFLFIASLIISLFTSCGILNHTYTKDEGVLINGVKWATRNVDSPGYFVAKSEVPGMVYQWNRKTGWATDSMINSDGETMWDSSVSSGAAWRKSNDPSPAGWRLPAPAEIESLFDRNKVSNEWTTVNGVGGRKFTDKTTGNSLFLPAAGSRGYRDGDLYNAGKLGFYWGSAQGESYYLYFGTEKSTAGFIRGSLGKYGNGFSVRSVAE
jgi:uncharacterized protein (TIGR02145 family)